MKAMSLSNLRRWLILWQVPHEEKEKLREVLQALLEDGSVELTSRGKYVKAAQEHLTGVFTAHPRGFGFVSVEGEDEDIFIPAPYVNGAFHKDIVRVKGDQRQSRRGKTPGGRRHKSTQTGHRDAGRHFYAEQIFWICPSGRYALWTGCVHSEKMLRNRQKQR